MSSANFLRLLTRGFKTIQSLDRLYSTPSLNFYGNGRYFGKADNRNFCLSSRFLEKIISINIYETPNPNSIKFHLGQNILGIDTPPRDFPSEESAKLCSLAGQLHKISGIKGVYIGQDFVTISKLDGVDWSEIREGVNNILDEYFSINKFVQISIISEEETPINKDGNKDDDIVSMIKELIESKIRPTIQEDGGDIIYMGFENGVVKVKLQGSCSGCPSSEVTLKRGVQNMLKFYVPEVVEVVQVYDEKDNLSDRMFETFDDSLDRKT